MSEIKATIKLENGKGTPVSYELTMTRPATKNEKSGKTSFAQLQPAPGNAVLMPFSKIYVNTGELDKALKPAKAAKS